MEMSPGTCANHASRHWECCGPAVMYPPMAVLITMGTFAVLPNM